MVKKLLFALALLFSPLLGEMGTPWQGGFYSAAFAQTGEDLIICNEGNWQSDNGQLSYYDGKTGTLTNQWFRQINKAKLGDTPNDIIQVNDTLIAIAVNWSNIIQFIHPDGTACGATEGVPNNRRLCSDGKYLYVTSYAHKCGTTTFTKGYVANTGGYAFQEGHDYETTISVVDATTMTLVKNIDTGCINLYSEMSQAGQYLCVNSAGDYYDNPPKTIVLDCETDKVTIFGFPCTYNTTDGKKFYTIGSQFSFDTGDYTWFVNTIDPQTMTVTEGIFNDAITQKIKSLTAPYEIYVSPYTGNIYFTDAQSYASAGDLYGYTADGKALFGPLEAYISPAHILAVKPQTATAINSVTAKSPATAQFYNLAGQRVNGHYRGIVVRNGKKYIQR